LIAPNYAKTPFGNEHLTGIFKTGVEGLKEKN